MSTTAPAGDLYLVVGYDGSPPATRALDAAANLLRGRTGRIEVVYVAHLPSIDMMSSGAVAEMEVLSDHDEAGAERADEDDGPDQEYESAMANTPPGEGAH